MLKKALGLVITAIMLLGIFGLTACNNDTLDAYKTEGKAAIEAYAQERKNNYCEDNWTVVCGIVTAGKTAVDEAESKPAVDKAVTTAKAEIDAAQDIGSFYSLQKAFDNGWLTKEDLQSIAYYLNDDSMPIYPNELSVEIEKAIKETRAFNLRAEVDASGVSRFPDAKAEDISFRGYYGNYNNLFAVMIADSFTEYGQAEWSEIVDGVTFHYADGNRILIWKEETKGTEQMARTFYTLQKAYDDGLLTAADLQGIANHFNNDTAPTDNLSLELQEAIKETRAEKLRNLNSNPILEAKADDVSIVKYYGTFSGAIAVVITDIYSNYGQGELPEYEIGGVVFYNYGAPEIQIWKH